MYFNKWLKFFFHISRNIFLNGADITLGDLGLARSVEPKDNNVYSFVGTFNYMSPELINNKGYLFKSDIWYLFSEFFKAFLV